MIHLCCDKYSQHLKGHLEEQDRGGCFQGTHVLRATSMRITMGWLQRPSRRRGKERRCTHVLVLQESMAVLAGGWLPRFHGTLSRSLMESQKSMAIGSSAKVFVPPEPDPCRAGRTTPRCSSYIQGHVIATTAFLILKEL